VKVDASRSAYQESADAQSQFNRQELKRCRYLLRRLVYLEAQVGESTPRNAGVQYAEWEIEALEWILTDVGFLITKK